MSIKGPLIVVTQRIHEEVLERLTAAGDVDVNLSTNAWSHAELCAKAVRATALLRFMSDRVDADLIEQAPQLRIVACALKGTDNYDIEACTGAGIWVSAVPDLLTAPTAELALGLAIGLARHLRAGDAWVRSGSFAGWRPQLYGTGLDQAVVAVIGLGALGRAIVDRLQGFGCRRILGVDPTAEDARVVGVALSTALAEADYVFVAAPLTPESRGLIDRAALARAKPGQMMTNVGRGSVVDEGAVAAALASGRLGGYAADVFAFEDWALADRPRAIPQGLLESARTLFTPHLGSAVRDVRLAIEHLAADNILAVLAGSAPRDAVNAPQVAMARRVLPRAAPG